MNGIFWKKFFEFLGELGSEGFIVGEDEGWPLTPSNNIGHRKSFPRSSDSKKGLILIPIIDRCHEFPDGFGLIPSRGIGRMELEDIGSHKKESLDSIYFSKSFNHMIFTSPIFSYNQLLRSNLFFFPVLWKYLSLLVLSL